MYSGMQSTSCSLAESFLVGGHGPFLKGMLISLPAVVLISSLYDVFRHAMIRCWSALPVHPSLRISTGFPLTNESGISSSSSIINHIQLLRAEFVLGRALCQNLWILSGPGAFQFAILLLPGSTWSVSLAPLFPHVTSPLVPHRFSRLLLPSGLPDPPPKLPYILHLYLRY